MANASTIFTLANAKILAVVAAVGLLVTGIIALASAWESMSGAQRVVAVLGTLAAATAAAIAIGVFHASATMGLAAAGIAAGIAAVTAAVLAAQSQAKSAASSVSAPITNYGGGTPYTANSARTSYTGGYQGTRPSGNQTVILQMDGATMARGMMPYLDSESQRRGVQIAGG